MLDTRKACIATAAAAALLVTVSPGAGAQSSTVSYGVTAAAFGFQDGHQEQALGAIIQLTPTRWLSLGASPTLLRVSAVDGSESRFGITDLPVYAGVFHSFDAPWRPTLGFAGVASLPTGDALAFASVVRAIGIEPVELFECMTRKLDGLAAAARA